MRNGLIAFCLMIILLNIAYIAYRKQQPEPLPQVGKTLGSIEENTFTLGNLGRTSALETTTAQTHSGDLNPVQGEEIIRGVVLTAAGAPAAGAEVLVSSPPSRDKLLHPTAKANRWHTIAEEDGTFQFDTLPEGQLLVFATDQTHHAVQLVQLRSQGAAGDVALHLGPSRQVQGRVTDSNGKAIPNARIYPVHESPTPAVESPYLYLPAHSDHEGNFGFPFLNEDPWSFLVVAKNFAPALAQPEENTSHFQVALNVGKSLEGTLYNATTERYINNARIELIENNYGLERTRQISAMGGTFRFETLRPGSYTLSINSDTYTLDSGTAQVEIIAGETVPELELTVVRAGQVRGRILDRKGRNGVNEIEVVATPVGEGQSATRSAKSDLAGYYRITGLAEGSYIIEAHAPTAYILQAPTAVKIAAQAGKQVNGPDFHVGTGTKIQGIVVNAQGHPVSNASVRLSLSANREAHGSTRSDGDGLFVLKNIDPEIRVRIWAEKGPDISMGFGPVQVSTAGLEGLTFTLDHRAGASIHGSVSNAQGRPIAQATVECIVPDASLLEPLTTETDAEGHYHFTDLLAGSYALQAGASTESINENAQIQINVERDSAFEGADIVLP